MISLPVGTRVWLAAGVTDMRRGFDGLASIVQHALLEDPFSGQVFVFRCRKGDRIKVLWFSGDGMCLFAKRLEQGYLCGQALTRYLENGEIEIDNSAAERSLHGVALGRKNYLFRGSERGGERAATMYSLMETAKLNGINAEAYLQHVLSVIAEHPINQVGDLLPWNLKT